MSIAPATDAGVDIDIASAAWSSSGPVMLVLWLLAAASLLVWVLIVVKARQLVRWQRAELLFERAVGSRPTAQEADELVHRHPDALGAAILRDLVHQRGSSSFLEAIAERSVGDARHRASTFMTVLATIGSAAPFVGLFGTVWGILDAFLRIGREQSASLPVVAPAIGEALLATAVGLAAAIPAVIGYNFLSRRLDALATRLRSSARVWARAFGGD